MHGVQTVQPPRRLARPAAFLSLQPAGYALGSATGQHWLWNQLTPFWVFVVFPPIDTWAGLDTGNPPPGSDAALGDDRSYRMMPLADLPAHALMLLWGAPTAVALAGESLLAAAALCLSVGIVGGAIGITYAHELIHKPTRLERNAGGVLLALLPPLWRRLMEPRVAARKAAETG